MQRWSGSPRSPVARGPIARSSVTFLCRHPERDRLPTMRKEINHRSPALERCSIIIAGERRLVMSLRLSRSWLWASMLVTCVAVGAFTASCSGGSSEDANGPPGDGDAGDDGSGGDGW